MDEHNVFGTVDTQVVRIIDKFFRLILINELETVIGWDLIGFGQCLMNTIRDAPEVVVGFTFEQ
jgi:hypothetical protein